jgi:hypothetical protein
MSSINTDQAAPKAAPVPKSAWEASVRRDALGRYVKGQSGIPPEKRFKPGNPQRWQPGQCGNPAGVPKARADFERAFYQALMQQGSPDEAAALLWTSARKHEPWAVQLLLQRIAPETSKVRLEVARGQDEIDFTRLTDAELAELERILESARQPAPVLAGGAVPTEFAKVP